MWPRWVACCPDTVLQSIVSLCWLYLSRSVRKRPQRVVCLSHSWSMR